jgi:hypothetical protein
MIGISVLIVLSVFIVIDGDLTWLLDVASTVKVYGLTSTSDIKR